MRTIYLLFIISFLITSCSDDDSDNLTDYDFKLQIKVPEELSLDGPFNLRLFINNVDIKNKSNVTINLKNTDNFNISFNGNAIEENKKITLNSDETESISFLISQRTIKEDSLLFFVTNSLVTKEIIYKIKVTDYSGMVSVNSTEGGDILGIKSKYSYDEEVKLTAVPKENYVFNGYFDKGGNLLSEESIYLFKFKEPLILFPNFAKGKGQILITPTEGGTIAGAGTYYHGETAVLSATPNNGYIFVGWFENEQLINEYRTFQFTVKNDRAIEAKFEKEKLTVILEGDINNLNLIGSGEYAENSDVTVSVRLKNNKGNFMGWYENDNLISTDNDYSFKLIRNITLKASYKRFLNVNANTSKGYHSVIDNGKINYNNSEINVIPDLSIYYADSKITIQQEVAYVREGKDSNDNVRPIFENGINYKITNVEKSFIRSEKMGGFLGVTVDYYYIYYIIEANHYELNLINRNVNIKDYLESLDDRK